ncbi:MAG: helix-hairpin-helix domain-containing protein [Pseudomonadota bacterium]
MKNIIQLFVAVTLLFASHFAVAEVVNINTADAQTLAANIVGVGEKKSLAIVAFRDEHGPFKSVDEMTQVKGIGLKLVDKNRENLTIKSK